jgi:hypothetical protein
MLINIVRAIHELPLQYVLLSKLVSVGIMKFRASKRPIAITILASVMIGTSALLIGDRLLNFYIYRLLEGNVPLADSSSINLQLVSGMAFLGFGSINLQLVSGMAFLGFGIVPILLAVGLWHLKSWARVLSIFMFSSILFPAIATCFNWISPTVFDDVFSVDQAVPISRLMMLNPYIAVSSAIALAILLTPAIGKTFRHHS